MFRTLVNATRRSNWLRSRATHLLYQKISQWITEDDLRLMNYGFAYLDPDPPDIELSEEEEKYRLSLQLYHYVTSATDLAGRDVLEVGSGRGGGAVWVQRSLSPAAITGVDFSQNAVNFCVKKYQQEGLRFLHGNAENLPLDDGQFDVVLNIESSHHYSNIAAFFREVYRVLRNSGLLLWANFHEPENIPSLREEMIKAGFEILKDENITSNVVASMDIQSEDYYRQVIKKYVPKRWHPGAYHFSGAAGTHNLIRTGRVQYYHMVLQKFPAGATRTLADN